MELGGNISMGTFLLKDRLLPVLRSSVWGYPRCSMILLVPNADEFFCASWEDCQLWVFYKYNLWLYYHKQISPADTCHVGKAVTAPYHSCSASRAGTREVWFKKQGPLLDVPIPHRAELITTPCRLRCPTEQLLQPFVQLGLRGGQFRSVSGLETLTQQFGEGSGTHRASPTRPDWNLCCVKIF